MVNFASVLDMKVKDVKRPPNMPIGTYTFTVSKIPEQGVFAEGRWEHIDFAMRCVGATENVDAEDLASYGDPTRRTLRKRFLFDTEDEGAFNNALFQVTSFCKNHLQVEGADEMTIPELLNATVHHQCLGEVKWTPNKQNPEIIYDELGRTAPLA